MSFDPSSSVSGENNLSYLNQDNEVKPIVIRSQRSPTTADRRYKIGTLWVNQQLNRSFQITSVSAGTATWVLLASGTGDLETLTGDSGGTISPDGAGNINIVGNDLLTVDGAGDTLTINETSGAYPITPYVVGPVGQAGYQTIQAGLDAANASGGGMVFVQGGTYNENLTFFDNIQLFGDSEQGTIIIGTHVPPSSGTLNINRVTLQSATDIFNSAAAGTTDIILEDSTCAVTNGYTFNLPNWTGAGSIANFNIGNFGTDDGYINNTGGTGFFVFSAGVGNGIANPMIISGFSEFASAVEVGCPVNLITGANLTSIASLYDQTVTLSGNASMTSTQDTFSTGATPCIDYNSSANSTFSTVTFDSTNNPAIGGTGTGALTLTSCAFPDNFNIASTLTLSGGTTYSDAFQTINQSEGLNIGKNFIAALGSTANIDIVFNPQGTGDSRFGPGSVKIASVGEGLDIAEGANARQGTAVLVAGTVTVPNTSVTATSRIFLTSQVDGGAPGFLRVSARTVGVDFTITSSSGADTSTVAWVINEPA